MRRNFEYLQKRKMNLGTLPTPIQRMNLTDKLKPPFEILIKRDDLTGVGIGGNKVRPLEYLLYDALEKESDMIIASGPSQSNLCSLASACASRLGLETHLVINGEKPVKNVGNDLLNEILGVKFHYIGRADEYQRAEAVEELKQELIAKGHRPYVIYRGASTGLGALGYMNAVVEIDKQNVENNLGIENIFGPGGNGGVAAGLVLGNALLGNKYNLNIISVEYDAETLDNNIKAIIEEARELEDLHIDGLAFENYIIYDRYRGAGWGQNTEESSKEVIDFARREGIFIENIYVSKTVVGMKDLITKGKVEGNSLFIHTGGIGALFAQY